MDVILILPSSIFFSFSLVTSVRSGHLILSKLWTVTLTHNLGKLLELIFCPLTDTSLPMTYEKQSVWTPWDRKFLMNQPFSWRAGELGIRKEGIFHGRWWLEQVGYSSFPKCWSSPLTMTWAIQREQKQPGAQTAHCTWTCLCTLCITRSCWKKLCLRKFKRDKFQTDKIVFEGQSREFRKKKSSERTSFRKKGESWGSHKKAGLSDCG